MRLVAIISLLACGLDQISKWWVIHQLNLGQTQRMDIISPYLNLRYGENRGINFGLLGQGLSPWVLALLAAVICLAVIWWLRKGQQPQSAQISAGLVIGGGLGNVIDRLHAGFVYDFINMSCCGINNPYVFNVADIFIFSGILGLAIFAKDHGAQKHP